jgi:hypothetical protein
MFFAFSSTSLRLPRALVHAMFADKYLKKRYPLPQKGHTRSQVHYLPENGHTPCVHRF